MNYYLGINLDSLNEAMGNGELDIKVFVYNDETLVVGDRGNIEKYLEEKRESLDDKHSGKFNELQIISNGDISVARLPKDLSCLIISKEIDVKVDKDNFIIGDELYLQLSQSEKNMREVRNKVSKKNIFGSTFEVDKIMKTKMGERFNSARRDSCRFEYSDAPKECFKIISTENDNILSAIAEVYKYDRNELDIQRNAIVADGKKIGVSILPLMDLTTMEWLETGESFAMLTSSERILEGMKYALEANILKTPNGMYYLIKESL